MPLLIGILVLGVGALAYFAGVHSGASVAPGASASLPALPPPGAPPPAGTPLTPLAPPAPGLPLTLTLIPGGMHLEARKGDAIILLVGPNSNWIEPLKFDPTVFGGGSIPTEGPNPAQVKFLGGSGDLTATWLPPSLLPFGLLQIPPVVTTVHVREVGT